MHLDKNSVFFASNAQCTTKIDSPGFFDLLIKNAKNHYGRIDYMKKWIFQFPSSDIQYPSKLVVIGFAYIIDKQIPKDK